MYNDIGAVGFELWIVNKGSIFDNVFIGNSLEEAKEFAAETWGKISPMEKDVKQEYEDAKQEKEDDDDDDEEDGEDLDIPETKEELWGDWESIESVAYCACGDVLAETQSLR